MKKRYLFFASLAYTFPILRPLQKEIRERGDEVAWFLEPTCENWLTDDEVQLKSIKEIKEYNPIAIVAPGDHMYPFLPGVKVQVFHGYPINKRIEKVDSHFKIRGYFDIYCTQGPGNTPLYKQQEKEHGNFKVYETGWCKVDPYFDNVPEEPRKRPTVLYSSTFTRNLTSVYELYDVVEELVKTKPWDWIFTFHPKFDDQELLDKYRALAEKYDHVRYNPGHVDVDLLRSADIMLCDSSAIIIEFELLNKPVVTYRNTSPGPHVIDILDKTQIGDALEKAFTRPPELMEAIKEYTLRHEAHRDGKNSARVLDAVDDFIENYKGRLKKKRPGLFRRWQMWKLSRKK